VLTNLDAIAALAPPNVQVQGLLGAPTPPFHARSAVFSHLLALFSDAAAWVDVQPIIPGMLSLQEMTQDLVSFTQPPMHAGCASQYTGAEAWKCVWPSYLLPFLTTSYFMTASQFDGA
jgi:hypothetical protein